MENFISGLVGALIALAIERVLNWNTERRREAMAVANTGAFLRGWFVEAVALLEKIAKTYDAATAEWEEYLRQLEADSDAESVFPRLPYVRVVMPDIEEVVLSKSAYMSEKTYVGLLFLNRRLALLDERGRVLADSFFNAATSSLNCEVRIRFAKTALDTLRYARDLVTEAQSHAGHVDLGRDAGPLRIGGAHERR